MPVFKKKPLPGRFVVEAYEIHARERTGEKGSVIDTLLQFFWTDWRIGFVVALGLVVAAALVCAWFTPRGPVTPLAALWSMAIAITLGLLVGLLTGSRWSIILAPVIFMIVFETARYGFDGPTVDWISLTSSYGIIAFVTGRFLHGLLVLLPGIFGILLGLSLASYLGRDPSPISAVTGWILIVIGGLGLLLLTYFFAQPAATYPVTGSDGGEVPGSIAEIITVPIGGHNQVLMIRGRDDQNPVLLYLAGGPGGTDLGAMRADVSLEQDFVVVTWEQRGTGKSYAALDPVETLTMEQMIADTLDVTNYLRERFNQEKVYLVGNSWGTILGGLTIQREPDLYHAFIGTGQMVSPRETDRMFYEDTIKWAEQNGNFGLVERLRQNGPPPYEDIRDYEPALAYEHAWNAYPELDTNEEMPFNLMVPENTLMDRINGLRAFLDTFAVLYPQLQDIDFREDVPALEVPYYMVLGEHEARGRAVLAREWFEKLDAPVKEMVIFEHSGHRPLFEEPAAFAALMAQIAAGSPVMDQGISR